MRFDLSFINVEPYRIWSGIAVLLFVYCLGHGFMVEQPLLPWLSVAWSLSHATGVMLIAFTLGLNNRAQRWPAVVFAVCAALAVSQLLFTSMTWLGGKSYGLHGYSSVVVYVAIGAVKFLYYRLLKRQAEGIWVDYGQRKVWLVPRDIKMVSAAKNYVEIVAINKETEGVVRGSISDFANQHSFLLRVHRSTLINPSYLESVQRLPRGCLKVTLQGGQQVKVSATYSEPVLNAASMYSVSDISSHT